ncbi:MAG: hypothetical protein COY40_05485 [Alphaproteobacteria bacterium CG_4_10_14_0_8_um_filter_53_9]|nr:MAG: hypothetical protein COY40_05485 [Alphaproteobacteria bacterium CG_4_10_14_0_8_um_filter_53_9]
MCQGHDICPKCLTVEVNGTHFPIGLPMDMWTGHVYSQEDGALALLATAKADLDLGTYRAWPELEIALAEATSGYAEVSPSYFSAIMTKNLMRTGLALKEGMNDVRAIIMAEAAAMEPERARIIALHQEMQKHHDLLVSYGGSGIPEILRKAQENLGKVATDRNILLHYKITDLVAGHLTPKRSNDAVRTANMTWLRETYPEFDAAYRELAAKATQKKGNFRRSKQKKFAFSFCHQQGILTRPFQERVDEVQEEIAAAREALQGYETKIQALVLQAHAKRAAQAITHMPPAENGRQTAKDMAEA